MKKNKETEKKVKNPLTLANKITIFRIVTIPLFVILLLAQQHPWPLLIFVLSTISDALDGFFARYRRENTPLGSFLDPLADKLLLLAAFITLTYQQRIPIWMFVVIFSRDLLIVIGWIIVYILTGSSRIEPRRLGKLTTVLQMLGIFSILADFPFSWQKVILQTMIICTILSGLDYIREGSHRLNPTP